MSVRLALALVLIAATPALACIWTTETIRDEVQLKDNAADFDLITGQFPHRSAGYWAAVKRRSLATLEREPKDLQARNDLGAALIKLGAYAESEKIFKALEAEDPKRYETLSNLGVLYKKAGRLEEAVEYTEKALSIKPSGHLGLGDTYLAMLRYRVELEAGGEPGADIFGSGYFKTKDYSRELWRDDERTERSRALIRSDRRFADGVFVFAEHVLRGRNLRLWAYVRALQLGHPRPDIIRHRIEGLLDYWRESVEASQNLGFLGRSRVQGAEETIAGITADLERAEAWLVRYEEVEGEMVARAEAEGRDFPHFDTVLKEMRRRRIFKVRPREHGILPPSLWAVTGRRPVDWVALWALVMVGLFARKLRRRPRPAGKEGKAKTVKA